MTREGYFFIGVLILLVLWPFLVGTYGVTLANRAMIYSLAALSFAILAGQLGWFSLCQTTFAGVSAYAIAILGVRFEVPFALTLMLALGVTLAFAVAFGLITLRTRAVGFLMLTLALGQMTWGLAYQWVDVTGGYNGIAGVRLPTVAGANLNDPYIFYVMLAVVTVLIFLGVHRLYRSSFGLLMIGIQENEQRMRALGHPVQRARFIAFVLAGMIGGVAGIFLVYDMGIMTPAPLDLGHAVWVLTAAVLGGYRSLWGPAIGVAILVALESVVAQYTDRHMMVIGFVLLLSILLMPNGLAEYLERFFARGKSRELAFAKTQSSEGRMKS